MNLETAAMILKRASEAQEQFPIVFLSSRAEQVANTYPNDSTTQGMYQFLSDKGRNGKLSISKEEFNKAYQAFFKPNNKFASHFKKEINTVVGNIEPIRKQAADSKDLVKEVYNEVDQDLVSGLHAMFGTKQHSNYTQSSANEGKKVCDFEFRRCGLNPKHIEVVAGQEDLLLVKADFDTPKGTTTFVVPVEIFNKRVGIPNLFLSSEGFANINQNNLKIALNKCAGQSVNHDLKNVLALYSNIKNGLPSKMGEVEAMLLKTKLALSAPAISPNAITGQTLKEVRPDVSNKIDLSKEAQSVSKQLASPVGAAQLLFGQKNVETSYRLVEHGLKTLGCQNFKMKVAAVESDSIYYQILLATHETFKVPVKISKTKVSPPEMIISSAGLADFSPQGLESVLDKDVTVLASFSPMHGLNSNELLQNVKTASLSNDKEKMEDALRVLQVNDPEQYKIAVQMYMKTLTGKEEKTSCCSKPIKVSNSIHWQCSHTGLPLHKVYQDKFGDCQPLYRQKVAEAQTVSSIQNRIYFE